MQSPSKARHKKIISMTSFDELDEIHDVFPSLCASPQSELKPMQGEPVNAQVSSTNLMDELDKTKEVFPSLCPTSQSEFKPIRLQSGNLPAHAETYDDSPSSGSGWKAAHKQSFETSSTSAPSSVGGTLQREEDDGETRTQTRPARRTRGITLDSDDECMESQTETESKPVEMDIWDSDEEGVQTRDANMSADQVAGVPSFMQMLMERGGIAK